MLLSPKSRLITPRGSVDTTHGSIVSVSQLVLANTSCSFMAWVRFASTGSVCGVLCNTNSGTTYLGLQLFGGSLLLLGNNGGSSATLIASVAANVWYFVAVVGSGTTGLGYARTANGALTSVSVTGNAGASNDQLFVGDDGVSGASSGLLTGVVAGFKAFNFAKSRAEILAESMQLDPTSRRGLVRYLPLPNARAAFSDSAVVGDEYLAEQQHGDEHACKLAPSRLQSQTPCGRNGSGSSRRLLRRRRSRMRPCRGSIRFSESRAGSIRFLFRPDGSTRT
jgi:hypothetical protein